MKRRRYIPRLVREYELFPTSESYALYLRALDWCIEESARSLFEPVEWAIPVAVINGWNRRRPAAALVDSNIWRHCGSEFHFVYVEISASPYRIASNRKKARQKQERKQARKRDGDSHPRPESAAYPPGEYPGDRTPLSPRSPRGDRE